MNPEDYEYIKDISPRKPIQKASFLNVPMTTTVPDVSLIEQPGQPIQSVQPGQPIQSVQPGQPIQSVRPGQPIQSVQPGQPLQSVQLGQPIQSVQPVQPILAAALLHPALRFPLQASSRIGNTTYNDDKTEDRERINAEKTTSPQQVIVQSQPSSCDKEFVQSSQERGSVYQKRAQVEHNQCFTASYQPPMSPVMKRTSPMPISVAQHHEKNTCASQINTTQTNISADNKQYFMLNILKQSMEQNFTLISTKMSRLDDKVSKLETKLTSIDTNTFDIQTRFEELHSSYREMRSMMQRVVDYISFCDMRMPNSDQGTQTEGSTLSTRSEDFTTSSSERNSSSDDRGTVISNECSFLGDNAQGNYLRDWVEQCEEDYAASHRQNVTHQNKTWELQHVVQIEATCNRPQFNAKDCKEMSSRMAFLNDEYKHEDLFKNNFQRGGQDLSEEQHFVRCTPANQQHRNTVDTSAVIDALASKHLPTYKRPNSVNHLQALSTSSGTSTNQEDNICSYNPSDTSANNMSLGTLQHMKKFNLLPPSFDTTGVTPVNKGYTDGATNIDINKKKHKKKRSTDKQAETEYKILDMSSLKRQPKLL